MPDGSVLSHMPADGNQQQQGLGVGEGGLDQLPHRQDGITGERMTPGQGGVPGGLQGCKPGSTS